MAIYHLTVKPISRGSGRSVAAAAAYRAADKIENPYDGVSHDYSKKSDVVFDKLILPESDFSKNFSRDQIWAMCELAEKRSDALLAREIEFALPVELDLSDQIELCDKLAIEYTNANLIVDYNIHKPDKKNNNPHCHMLVSDRRFIHGQFVDQKSRSGYILDESGQRVPVIDPATGRQKIGQRGRREWHRWTIKNVNSVPWHDKDYIYVLRKKWQDLANAKLAERNIAARVDCRSYADRGIDIEPTRHVGRTAGAAKRREQNAEIMQRRAIKRLADFAALPPVDRAAELTAAVAAIDDVLSSTRTKPDLAAADTDRDIAAAKAEAIAAAEAAVKAEAEAKAATEAARLAAEQADRAEAEAERKSGWFDRLRGRTAEADAAARSAKAKAEQAAAAKAAKDTEAAKTQAKAERLGVTYSRARDMRAREKARDGQNRKLAALGFVARDAVAELGRKKLFASAALKATQAAATVVPGLQPLAAAASAVDTAGDIASAAKAGLAAAYATTGGGDERRARCHLLDDLAEAQAKGVQLIPHLSYNSSKDSWEFMNDFQKKQRKFEELMRQI